MIRYRDRRFVWGKDGLHNLGTECGQRWWRVYSWRFCWTGGVRRFQDGWAFGPIMYWKDRSK